MGVNCRRGCVNVAALFKRSPVGPKKAESIQKVVGSFNEILVKVHKASPQIAFDPLSLCFNYSSVNIHFFYML